MTTRVEKPWGYYEDYFRGENVAFKKIVINPGHKISYQKHNLRSELWYVQSGNALLKFSVAHEPTLDYAVHLLREGESMEIPALTAHQLICHGEEPLVVYEMQFGAEISEDDIERIEDPYGRK